MLVYCLICILFVQSSFTIILTRKRELVGLLYLSSSEHTRLLCANTICRHKQIPLSATRYDDTIGSHNTDNFKCYQVGFTCWISFDLVYSFMYC